MFFSRLFTLSFAAVVLAGPFKRSNGISVQLTGPSSSVHSISDLTLTAVVTNTGAEYIKVLKYATVLDAELPTRSFTVTRNGTVVPFVGVKLSVSLEEADDSAYTTIPAGESVTLVHDGKTSSHSFCLCQLTSKCVVSALYDFASVGTGPFTFAPVTTFQTAPTTQKIAARSDLVTVEILSSPITIAVTGDVGRREPALNRRSQAKTLASTASSYVTSRGATDTLYRAYFGAIATSRVTSVLNAVANESSSTRTLSCTDTFGVCTAGVIAYTVISTTNIYFCSIFFSEVPSTSLCSGTSVASRNVRGGTTLHELTHATSGTDDVIYGCASDQALSDANSVINADNYNVRFN
ncbi:hypothetical protein B0H10DRAFT_1827991 [Mycena sp. CBHHK59/15]|nr:hypothetical protein B0H10DRAFT_1827991 [Mycena sp. CBHHK59/15]